MSIKRIQAYDGDYYWFPNQKQLKINREIVEQAKSSNRPYLVAYNDNILQAMCELSPSHFKVYMFLLMNKDGFRLEYSPKYIAEQVKISKDTAREAFKQMEMKGYFDRLTDSEYKYDFFEVPQRNSYKVNREDRAANSSLARSLEEQLTRREQANDYDDLDW